MNETVYDCIVIGAGISGLSFSHYLKRAGKNILVIEKNNRIGGQVQTGYSGCNHDYFFELGAHTCYNSYTNLLSIVKDIQREDLIQPIPKLSYVLYSDEKIKSIFSEVSKFSMLCHCFRYFFSDKTGKTTREYFQPIVGKGNYNHLFRNAFKAVISQPADDYPAEIFLKKRKEREESAPRKFTFKNGLSSILDAIIEKNGIKTDTLSEVINVRKSDNVFYVRTKDGIEYESKNVAFALNPQASAILLKEMESCVSELLSTIPIYHSESVNIIVNKDKLKLNDIAGIISLSDDFLSVVSRDIVKDEKFRSFTFHFEKGKKNNHDKIKIICNVLGISEPDIEETSFTEHSLPAMRLEHLHMSEKIIEMKKDDSIYVLGNYFYGLSLEDCVNRSKDEAERFIRR